MLGKALTTAAAGNAAGEGLYVEDVFSTYLYRGNNSTQTITNGIDLDGEGGLVWAKNRTATWDHVLFDTERGIEQYLQTNETDAEAGSSGQGVTSYNSDGFTLASSSLRWNSSSHDYVSWTFRKAPKFFDVVTYTGNGSTQNISHNLGSVPGTIIIKSKSGSYVTTYGSNWVVWHRSLATPSTQFLRLNTTEQAQSYGTASVAWNNTVPTDTTFTLGPSGDANSNGDEYVAYLFAHNDGDGEFGEDADQDIIKCGSYTADSSNNYHVDVGFEPQWVMIKKTSGTGDWEMLDVMRGFTADASAGQFLEANNSNAEFNDYGAYLTSTGFVGSNQSGSSGASYIYIAIRRGPMKTPESGTEVFAIDTQGSSSGKPNFKSGFPVDFAFVAETGGSGRLNSSRLTSPNVMYFNNTNAEASDTERKFDYQNGWGDSVSVDSTRYSWMFRRAPGFFDVVAYEGNDVSGRTISHNLGVVPELMFIKRRDDQAQNWIVYAHAFGGTKYLELNKSDAVDLWSYAFADTDATATSFTVGGAYAVNDGGAGYGVGNYIAYLFATLPGVSKVGSYTGNGTSQTIDCGFSAGARFVLTKRTNTTGNWNVWDSERGIVAGNDPRLELNTTDAEDTGHDYIDPDSSGFVVNYVADDDDDSNVSGDTYIFLAIA